MHRALPAHAGAAAAAGHTQSAGGDDFALYGDTYGTLLIDATARLPLTLWEGRDAEQLSRWLRSHPGVEIACRDGSLTYRQGIADGAPNAGVKMALAPLRRGLPLDEPRERPPSPREAARWIITAPERHGLQTAERLRRLLEHCPELRRTHELVRQFAAMLDTRDATPLPWDAVARHELRRSGAWWQRMLVGDYVPAVMKAPPAQSWSGREGFG